MAHLIDAYARLSQEYGWVSKRDIIGDSLSVAQPFFGSLTEDKLPEDEKKFFDLLNPPRHGLHGHLVEDEKVCLKTSPQSCPCRFLPHLHFKSFGEDLVRNRNLYNISQKL